MSGKWHLENRIFLFYSKLTKSHFLCSKQDTFITIDTEPLVSQAVRGEC